MKRYEITKQYKEYHSDEISEFIHIYTKFHPWLHVDILLDDDEQYIINKHPLWIYFRNSYNNDIIDFIPLVITPTYCYIPMDVKLNISYYDFDEVRQFCMTFYNIIKSIADCKVDSSELVIAANNMWSHLINESSIGNKHPLFEMAKLPKSISGLPRDLYIDEDRSYIRGGHGPRIKFQEPLDIKTKRKWSSIDYKPSMTLDTSLDELDYFPSTLLKKENEKISNTELNHIKYFILANAQLLKDVADEIYDFEYFKQHFKKVDANGNIIYDPDKKPYVFYKRIQDLDVVRHNTTNKFNFLKNNKLISSIWFDEFTHFLPYKNTYRAFVRYGNKTAFLEPDGTLIPID